MRARVEFAWSASSSSSAYFPSALRRANLRWEFPRGKEAEADHYVDVDDDVAYGDERAMNEVIRRRKRQSLVGLDSGRTDGRSDKSGSFQFRTR